MPFVAVNADNLEQQENGEAMQHGQPTTANNTTIEMLPYPTGVSTCPKRYSEIMGRVSPSIRGTSIVARIMDIESRVTYSS